MDIQAIYEDKYSSFAYLPYYQEEKQFYGYQFELFWHIWMIKIYRKKPD